MHDSSDTIAYFPGFREGLHYRLSPPNRFSRFTKSLEGVKIIVFPLLATSKSFLNFKLSRSFRAVWYTTL